MSDLSLQIIEQDGELLVDSRLVAAKLDIDHGSFVRTLKKYQDVIEPKFGCVRFKIIDIPMPNGGTRQEVEYYLLNENQATVLMTFSRNTAIVVQCKLDLVDAFSQAKKLLAKSVPALPSRELALETARSVSEIKDLLADTDPRLCQLLVDVAINDAVAIVKAISPASDTKWMGVAEIAESLKLPVTPQNRTSLGKFVKATCGEIGKQESRICNGRMIPIWCYPFPNADVEKAVKRFFE